MAGADSYKVRWRAPNGGFEPANLVNTAATSAGITVADYGRWWVRVEACKGETCGFGTIYVADITPALPENLAVSVTAGSLNLTAAWDDVDGADSYLVRWRTSDYDSALNAGVETQTSDASITVADYGRWVVRVQACNDAGCGPAAIQTVGITPARPENLAVSATPGALNVAASWDAAAGTFRYRLRWRPADGDGEFPPANLIATTATNATITVSDFGQWIVRLEACNDGGCGDPVYQQIEVEAAPQPTPQPVGQGYRGQLGEVLVELSLRRPAPGWAASDRRETKRASGGLPGQEQGGFRAQGQGDIQGQSSHTTSIVYVIDDSGSMDGDFPEVRKALKDVRGETMADTKVALIKFGTDAETVFGLTDHSMDATTGPWTDARINSFGGKLGGTFYRAPLESAKALLDADTATTVTTKKIIFLTDAQAPRPAVVDTIDAAGIIVDTIGFGDHFSDNFDVVEKIATDTDGTYKAVAKPSQGTTNSPAVTATALADILKGTVADNTATLFLVDNSFSVYGANADVLHPALTAAADKAGESGSTGRQVGLAAFLGETTLFTNPPDDRTSANFQKYQVVNAVGSASLSMDDGTIHPTGSTDLDHALQQAYSTITDSSVTATNKRVVLITDGISAVDVQQSPTLDNYKNNSAVTLDVVAWGAHADRVQLKTWADAASGNFSVAKAGPPRPTGFAAQVGDATLALSWNNPSDSAITKYQYRYLGFKQASDGSIIFGLLDWMDLPGSDASSTLHVFTGLSNDSNINMYWGLRIRAAYGDDLPGAPSFALDSSYTPDARHGIGLTATAGNGQIDLSWNNPGYASITGYQYAQREGDGGWTAWTDISGSDASTTTHAITGLTNGTAYTIAVRAVRTGVPGPLSHVTATPSN